MKKLLAFILAMFIGTLSVSAESKFTYDWDNSNFNAWSTEVFVETDDGYLLGGYDYDFYGQIVKFDKNGEVVDEITFDTEFTVVGLHVKDNNIYAVVLDDWWYVTLYKLDMNLNVVDKLVTDYYLYDWNDVVYFGENGVSLTTLGFYQFEGVADYEDNMYAAMHIGYDLETVEILELDAVPDYSLFKNYYPTKYKMVFDKYDNYERDGVPIAVDSTDEMSVVVGKIHPNDYSGAFIRYYDTRGNVLFAKDIEDVAWWYVDVAIHGEYILAVGTNYNNIDVYDFDGNLVEQINIKNQYVGVSPEDVHISAEKIISDGEGIVVTHSVCDVIDDCAVNCINSISRYDFKDPYKVYTRTDGNGTVTPSVTEAYPDEEVTFVVTPNEGYKVAYVKVTDANGKEVYFPGNKFTMPNADVTIEAAFTIDNPKTGAKIGLITTGALVITMIGLPIITKAKKKDKLFNV